jgi:hypothetical protein
MCRLSLLKISSGPKVGDMFNNIFRKKKPEPIPRMIRNPYLAPYWDQMNEEQQIFGEIFHPDDLPNIPGKLYIFRWPEYWFMV